MLLQLPVRQKSSQDSEIMFDYFFAVEYYLFKLLLGIDIFFRGGMYERKHEKRAYRMGRNLG